ncbi:MAG: methyltransferase [Methanoregulaceae archaeon]|nr:methyltransferase [Methanoregulaceae archaeon]
MEDSRTGIEQWCIRAPRTSAEEVRRELALCGRIDRRLRARTEGEYVLFPIIGQIEGAFRCEFFPYPERPGLPDHELVGGIAIMEEPDRNAAARLIASRPSVHTVLHPLGEVEGTYRTRRFEVLAGIPTTRTLYTEYGHRFAIDLAKAYFSARLSNERQRLLSLVSPGEFVLDMFAGVGPFSITLSEKAGMVVSSDANPGAVGMIAENIALNRTGNVLPLLADAARLPLYIPWQFDRVVMNLPMSGYRFLMQAFRLCRKGGYIHLYVLQEREGEFQEMIRSHGVETMDERFVRSYSPGKWHAVYDIRTG